MKELYAWQMRELPLQAIAHLGFGYLFCYPFLGPFVKSAAHGWVIRLAPTLTFATYLALQSSAWERNCEPFHEVITQPAPHGSYLRQTVKHHFPMWWNTVSANLHANGYSLPEMNEYDKSTSIQEAHTQFDSSIL